MNFAALSTNTTVARVSLLAAAFAALVLAACQPASTPTNSGSYSSPSAGEPADPNRISTEQGGSAGASDPAVPPPSSSAPRQETNPR